jgi:hypothetical protein
MRSTLRLVLCASIFACAAACNGDSDENNNNDTTDTGMADTAMTDTENEDTGSMADADAEETDTADADTCPETEVIDSDITEDTTWSGSPDCVEYRVTDGIVVEATLTIEPATQVVFEEGNYLSFEDGGILSAAGNESEPITFAGTEQTSGFWRGLSVTSNQQANELDHVIIRDAGSQQWSGESTSYGAVYTRAATLTITNTTFRNNANVALQVNGGEASIAGFENNTFVENDVPMWLHQEHVGDLAGTSTFTDNNEPRIQVTFFDLDVMATDGTWKAFEIPYRLMTSTTIEAGLTLEAGTTIEATQNVTISLENSGTLTADGTESDPVVIRGAEQLAGHWKGINVSTSSTDNRLTYTDVRHAGSIEWTGSTENDSRAAIYVGDNGTIDLDNATIAETLQHGVFLSLGRISSCEGTSFEDIPGDNVFNNTGDDSADCGL